MAIEGIRVGDEVEAALARGQAVVALESTLFAHGLPQPRGLETARELEELVRRADAVPATVGVVGGVAAVGLSASGIERLAAGGAPKLSVRDLPAAAAVGSDGATTVAATAALAAAVGVRVFATGGLGGVHREARGTWDESADLVALARTPIAVVCSGVKSILDVAATLERLETLGVTVVGYRTRRFPGFYLTDAGFDLDWSVSTPQEAAAVVCARDRLGLPPAAVVVANPVPVDDQLDPDVHDAVLRDGQRAAADLGVTGKAVTPFLLDFFHRATRGASLDVNLQLVRGNTELAARIAVAMAGSS